MVDEDPTLQRTRENYAEDVSRNDPKETGLKEACAFHDVIGFHLTENVTVDFMHDILEGVADYDLTSILHHFIYVARYFTLDTLNQRIKDFEYN